MMQGEGIYLPDFSSVDSKDLEKLLKSIKDFQDKYQLLRQYPPKKFSYAE